MDGPKMETVKLIGCHTLSTISKTNNFTAKYIAVPYCNLNIEKYEELFVKLPVSNQVHWGFLKLFVFENKL